MAKLFEVDDDFNKWYDERPPVIREMIDKLPINLLYRMTRTNQLVTMNGYNEDGTVSVNVFRMLNPFCLFERNVFGVKPENLEPITDLTVAGAVATEAELEAYVDKYFEDVTKRHG